MRFTAALATIFLLIVAVYLGCYFFRSQIYSSGKPGDYLVRYYSTPYEAMIFRPAAEFETIVRGQEVVVAQPLGSAFGRN